MSAHPPESASPLAAIRVVLVGTQHPGNIGSTARAMLTMGLSQLVLVRPRRFPDPQASALASNAHSVLDAARVVDSLEEAVADCAWVVGSSARQRHLGDEPMTPWEAGPRLVEAAVAAPVALVFGCERTGLTTEETERCHALTSIPANPEYSSLNLAQAVQLYTWELRKAAIAAGHEQAQRMASKTSHPWYQPPTNEQMENFYAHLERTLLGTGFLDPENPRLLLRRLRQLFNRARPDLNEVNILRGILSSVERPKRRRPADAPAEAGTELRSEAATEAAAGDGATAPPALD